MLSRAPARLSVGLAALAAILLVFAGIAVFALPTQCVPGLPGAWACLSTQKSVPNGQSRLKITSTPSGVGTTAAAPSPATAMSTVSTTPGKPAAGNVASQSALIDATFAQLQSPTPAAQSTKPAATATAPVTARAPSTRVVATTVIHPSVVPAGNDTISAYAEAPSGGTDTPAAEAAALPRAASADPVPLAAPSTPRPAASSGTAMIVGGGGVTVRSGPSRGRGQLFNLAAGEKVTVTARQRGWVQITDSQGRQGWAYSSLLRNS